MSHGNGFRALPAPRPLDGVCIVDLSQNLAGPLCTQILADLGADVIKVEPLTGDPARAWGPPFWNGESTLFLSANRNKRSIAIDLKTADGLDVALRLIRNADVFVQAFRAGVIESLGLGADRLMAANPRLIYASITAYGTHGPLRSLPGYDPLMQAHGGLMSITGHTGDPVRVGTSVVDMGTALWAVIGIQAALAQRERSGTGTHVVASLYETTLAWNSYHMLGYWATGDVPRARGTAFASIVPYGAFPTADGNLMIAAANNGLFRRLCEAIGLPELLHDDRFRDNPSRVAEREALDRLISAVTRTLTTQDLEARLRDAGVPCAPILDIAGVAAEEQTWASGIVDQEPGPRLPGSAFIGPPLAWNETRSVTRRPPPRIGEHSIELLAEIGISTHTRDDLIERGIILATPASNGEKAGLSDL